MPSRYLIINIIIIFFPLVLSFDRKVHFYNKVKNLIMPYIIVSGLYLLWDVNASIRGDWFFNALYVSSIKLFHLPPGEWMFFFTVPYACIFLYETFNAYFTQKHINIHRALFIILGILLFIGGFFFLGRDYTSTVLMVGGVTMIVGGLCFISTMRNSNFWLYLGISMILFFIFNYLLTSIPIVMYNPDAITGIRVLTIPIEDFLYNAAFLTLFAQIYDIGKKGKQCIEKQ